MSKISHCRCTLCSDKQKAVRFSPCASRGSHKDTDISAHMFHALTSCDAHGTNAEQCSDDLTHWHTVGDSNCVGGCILQDCNS